MTSPAIGVCYYPEHWPEDMWERDAARMAEVGIKWVRIGEFAWSKLEPAPAELASPPLVSTSNSSVWTPSTYFQITV